MLSYSEAFRGLVQELAVTYDRQEAHAIAQRYMEHLTGLSYTQRLVQDGAIEGELFLKFEKDKQLLVAGKPLQQVVGYEWFMNRKFKVNEQVLIPRPETEELVAWIIEEQKGREALHILDIGTGTGCIPVTLKLELPQAEVMSCDVSKEALLVAGENARLLDAKTAFTECDFLDATTWNAFSLFDIIVSNPPYIPETEMENIHTNVKEYEPHTALFVPDNDPLLFYRAIATFGKEHLNNVGVIYCELHVDHALQTANLFTGMGYETELKKDMHGNLRMLKAVM